MSSPPSHPTLPIIDLSPLSHPSPTPSALRTLSTSLTTAFSTTGFAYLTHTPPSLTDTAIFALAANFFNLPEESKLAVAKRSYRPGNKNTYRGFFPPEVVGEEGKSKGNCKEGLDIGPPGMAIGDHHGAAGLPTVLPGKAAAEEAAIARARARAKARGIDLTEGNVWPADEGFAATREGLEKLHGEMQALAGRVLGLLAVGLGLEGGEAGLGYLMEGSVSTLRLLHYPPSGERERRREEEEVERRELCCTPHTDSGILTLLVQDGTGGLEVLLSGDGYGGGKEGGEWVPAPYVPDSIVVNVGDLMARLSGGRFRATMHRVRSSPGRERFSVPFFFEPGVDCVVRSVGKGVGEVQDEGVVYGWHVLEKMKGWVEFQDELVGAEKVSGMEVKEIEVVDVEG